MKEQVGVRGQVIPAIGERARTEVRLEKRPRVGESIIQTLLFLCGMLSILTTIGIVVVLVREALLFFGNPEVSLVEFFTSPSWQPRIENFGIAPLALATLRTSFIALLVALPLGLAAAVYLSEYATPRVRNTIKPILEILAGVPTIVYGYFALQFMTPVLRAIFGTSTVNIFNNMSAGLVMGIMITPLISSMSEDALSAVPRSLREGAYGLGATRWETAMRIVLPAAISGIAAAVIVGMSRAVGETMIVAVASGAGPKLTFNPFDSAETMTAHMVRISGGDLGYGTLDYTSLFAIGLTLFIITFGLNLISQRIIRRFREVYE